MSDSKTSLKSKLSWIISSRLRLSSIKYLMRQSGGTATREQVRQRKPSKITLISGRNLWITGGMATMAKKLYSLTRLCQIISGSVTISRHGLTTIPSKVSKNAWVQSSVDPRKSLSLHSIILMIFGKTILQEWLSREE